MKILIACYSYTGNTLKVAEEFQKITDADLTRIDPVKNGFYLLKIWGALREHRAEINPCQTDIMDYDSLVVCCPVWAGKTPAGINQYLDDLKNIKGRKFGVFVTMKGSGNQKAAQQIRENLTEGGMEFLGQMIVTEADLKSGKYKEMVEFFAKKFQD